MSSLPNKIRGKLSSLRRAGREHLVSRRIRARVNASSLPAANEAEYLQKAAARAGGFVESLKSGKESIAEYGYSRQCPMPTLYASVYACLSLSVLGRLESLAESQRRSWASYFDSFQDPDSGLFFDPVTRNSTYDDSDWWGARHIALHLSSAYRALGFTPKYPFAFLRDYYDLAALESWLSEPDWNSPLGATSDIDNKLMNVGCLLQYQRDTHSDGDAERAVVFIRNFLRNKVNPDTGMWGTWNLDSPQQRSRMVQFAYHLYPLFLYDDHKLDFVDRIVAQTLQTRNAFGGFGVPANSSACEDIDSIDILCRLAPEVPGKKAEIDAALRSALRWVLCNQVDDGGFVFKLDDGLTFGHPELSSPPNQGAIFPTWFRLLSLAYLARYFDHQGIFTINPAPGYEF